MLVMQLKEDGRTLSSDLQETLSELENILYATAEGFEVPQGEEYLR